MRRGSGFGWVKRLKENRESVRDVERCGRSKEVINQIRFAKGLGLGLLL